MPARYTIIADAFALTTTAKTDDEARALLKAFNFPFRQ